MNTKLVMNQRPELAFSDSLLVIENSFEEAIESLLNETRLEEAEIDILTSNFRRFFFSLTEVLDEEGVFQRDLVNDYINIYLNEGISKLVEFGIDNSVISRFTEFRALLQEFSSVDTKES